MLVNSKENSVQISLSFCLFLFLSQSLTTGCCEKTDFQASRFRSIWSSIFSPLASRFFFLSLHRQARRSASLLCLSISLFRLRAADSRSAWLLYCVSLSRWAYPLIGAWQKCNAREVRGHLAAISHACEGKKQGLGKPRASQSGNLHCADLVSARPQGRVTKCW